MKTLLNSLLHCKDPIKSLIEPPIAFLRSHIKPWLKPLLQGGAAAGGVMYSGMKDAMRQIFLTQGIRGFYRGYLPSTLKMIPMSGASFATYEMVKQKLMPPQVRNSQLHSPVSVSSTTTHGQQSACRQGRSTAVSRFDTITILHSGPERPPSVSAPTLFPHTAGEPL
jgi:hypothetical protein